MLEREVGVPAPVVVHGMELLTDRNQPFLSRTAGVLAPVAVHLVGAEALVPQELLERQDRVVPEDAVNLVVLVSSIAQLLLKRGPLVRTSDAIRDERSAFRHPRRTALTELAVRILAVRIPFTVALWCGSGDLNLRADHRALLRLALLARREAKLLESDARVVGRVWRAPAPNLQV